MNFLTTSYASVNNMKEDMGNSERKFHCALSSTQSSLHPVRISRPPKMHMQNSGLTSSNSFIDNTTSCQFSVQHEPTDRVEAAWSVKNRTSMTHSSAESIILTIKTRLQNTNDSITTALNALKLIWAMPLFKYICHAIKMYGTPESCRLHHSMYQKDHRMTEIDKSN